MAGACGGLHGQKRVLLLLRNRKIIVVWERGGKVARLRNAIQHAHHRLLVDPAHPQGQETQLDRYARYIGVACGCHALRLQTKRKRLHLELACVPSPTSAVVFEGCEAAAPQHTRYGCAPCTSVPVSEERLYPYRRYGPEAVPWCTVHRRYRRCPAPAPSVTP